MTEKLPPGLTASTGMDAMTHAVESCVSQQRNPISDGMALHAIRLINTYLPRAVENGSDMVARGQMQIAALIAGWAFSNAMVGLVHAMAHSLGAICRTPHGLANGILLPYVMRYNLEEMPDPMQDIADAVQLQKASLYHHVESKQEILLSILEQALDLLIDDLKAVVQSDLSPEVKLRQAMQVYVKRLTKDTDLASVLLLDYRSLDPSMRASQNTRRDDYEKLWRQIIREGIEKGIFQVVDEAVAVFALLGIQNWMITWYREDGRLSARTLDEQFYELFLNGLLA